MKSALVGLVRSYARDRVIRKRLPPDLGGNVVFCSPDAMLSTWKPGWRSTQALQLFEWAKRYVAPGHVVWDIGANQGLFSFAALASCGPTGQVVAFEPDPFLTALLHRTRNAHHLGAQIDILPVAVAGDAGLAAFSVAAKDRALNHLSAFPGNPHTRGERDRMSVMTVSLNWIASHLRRPDLIKIDVEGAELEVLQGAGNLLRCIRPRWIIEVAPENSDRISALLRECRYRMFDASAPVQELESPAWNTLAVPEEVL